MKKDIISMCGAVDNATILTIDPAPCMFFSENTEHMLGRLLSLVNQLGPDRFIGLQITPELGEKDEVLVFSSIREKEKNGDYDWVFENVDSEDIYRKTFDPTEADYKWIFEKSANVRWHSKAEGLFGEGRRVYAISYEPVENGDEYMEIYTGNNSPNLDDNLWELIPALLREEAIVRLLTNGVFLFSLPGEIPFRLRSLISMSFPKEAKYTEIFSEPESNTSPCRISRRCFNWVVMHFWSSLQARVAERAEAAKMSSSSVAYRLKYELKVPYEVIATYGQIPIEDLELSVRSYNCLRRANINTVSEALFMDDAELMEVRNLGKKGKDEVKQRLFEYVKNDLCVQKDEDDEEKKEMGYQEMLDSLIGLEDVKKQVRKITAYAKMKRDMAKKGMKNQPIALHMQFAGNPGTAKTTVARIVAGIFREIGLLSKGGLIEVGRADLVGRYEGQTAPKVKEAFERAKGNVLFIDEAYSLVEEWEGAFGDEAINTIVQEMENNREDTIVIFAGYPDKMEDFISRNPGLRSRVPFKLFFRDYSEDELAQIAKIAAKEKGFSIDKGAEGTLAKLCREAAGKPEMGNGRFCRNLVEHAILDYAERVYMDDNPFVERNFVLLEEDLSLPMDTEVSKRRCIGFHSVA